MHASQLMQQVSVFPARLNALEAIRRCVEGNLPGLAVEFGGSGLRTVLSTVDLLSLTLPAYLREDANLAHVFDEDQANRIADRLASMSLDEALAGSRIVTAEVWVDTTLVEIADLMVRLRRDVVIVSGAGGSSQGTVDVVTAERVLQALYRASAGVSG